MIKLFSNRKFRRLGALILLGAQIGCFSSSIVGYAAPDPPSTPVPPVTIDTSAQDSASNSSGLSSGDVQSAAQSGAQAALDDSVDDISKQVADQLSGGTGVTWGDIYASLNEVDSSVKALNSYVSTKNITEKDYYATIVGMYLSQYVATMQGNLLNVVEGLESNLEDSKLDHKLMIGNKENAISLKDALSYIKSSYCVTPIYKGNEEQKINGVASLRDMYEKAESSLYIKDTELKIEDFEVTNTKGNAAEISKVSGADAYIPALSYSARNSDSFKINKLSLKEEEKCYCVFNSSSACRLALQLCYSELERYGEYTADQSMWQKKSELLDQGLYLDNFGNIVALDSANKQYTIVLNCMINPTICAVGSNEMLNMTAYGVNQVYSNHQESGSDALGLNYDKGNNAYEYRVALSSKAYDLLEKDGKSKYIGSKWVSNLLGATENTQPKANSEGYFAVFTFTDNDGATKKVTGPFKDKVNAPKNVSIDKTYGSTELDPTGHVKSGELNPASGWEPSVTLGSEGGKQTKMYSPDKSVSLAYIQTNHNRVDEAYWGYKNFASKLGEQFINVGNRVSWVSAVARGSFKATQSVRGNMDGYTIMPLKTSTLFYGIGETIVGSDSKKLKTIDPVSGSEKELDCDIHGYWKDYCSFYSGKGGKLSKYVGFLYTPKTTIRGKNNYVLQEGSANPPIKNLDAETIFNHLKNSCKVGILRKANIANLGRATSNGKKPKGMKGYQEATKKLIEEYNKKITDYITTGFDLADDSPVQGVKYKKIWALGLDIYDGESDLKEQSSRTVVVYDNCLGKSHKLSSYDTVSFFMAVTKNTDSSTVKVSSTGELSEEAKQSLKEEKATVILDRVVEMLTNPVKTFMKMVSGFLQWIHTGLSDGRLVSFFYVTDEDVNTWLRQMPHILMIITLMIFAVRMAIGALKFVFTKEYNFKNLAKDFISSATLVTVPIILLSLMRTGIATISDKGMNDSTIKIESVYLNKQLTGAMETEVSKATTEETSVQYFVEHFSSDRSAQVSVNILKNSDKVKNKTVNPNKGKTSSFTYETFNLSNLPAILINIAESNSQLSETDANKNKYGLSYDGKKFNTVLHDYYDESILFYFLDYYLNEWCLLNSKVEYYDRGDSKWAATMGSELLTSKDSFRNLYNKRAVIYGPSAGLTSGEECLDDIFGLGQLFYHDGKKASSRGYYLPIEIFDTKMAAKDKTAENSSLDLWNGYKHGSYFIDDRFTDEQKLSDEDTENQDRLGKSNNNMAYGFEALKARKKKYSDVGFKNQVIASEAVFKANNIDTYKATCLEQILWEVNDKIYSDVIDYFEQSTGEVCDYTDLVMISCISAFRFNEYFGKSFTFNDSVSFDPENSYVLKITDTIKPVSFDKEELDMDVILKAVYAGDKEVKSDYDLMYYLGSDTFGAIAAIILIVAEIFMIAYTIIRMVHLIIVYILTTVVCTFQYSLKKNYRNKAWLGVLAQSVYFLAAHLVQIFMLNMAVCNDLDRGSMTSILLSLLLLLGSGFGMAIEIKVMLFLVMNLKDLGGQIIADKLESAMATIKGDIKGKLNGSLKSDKVKIDADKAESYGNDDDKELKENGSGNTELAESVEQADKVRGEALLASGNGGTIGSTGENVYQNSNYMNVDVNSVNASDQSITGGDTFGDTNFESFSDNSSNSHSSINSDIYNSSESSTVYNDDSVVSDLSINDDSVGSVIINDDSLNR